jgi:succinoglycan biosynthesis protein ExoM
MPVVSVCIASYRRPEGLAHLLRSLAGQVSGTPPFEIVVVDNDRDRSAEAVVGEEARRGLPVRYLREPGPNIAKARNLGVRAAEGELIAFIDDDETAEADWLLNLHHGLVTEGAEAAFGPVIPRFSVPPPRWVEELGFFADRAPPTGTELSWHDTTTGNALVRYAALAALPDLFDEKLGRLGGEDVDLFARLAAGGARLISVPDAVVREDIPAERLTRRWMVRRYLRNGMVIRHVRAQQQSAGERWAFALRSAWKSCTCLCRAPLRGLASRREGIRELFRAFEHIGVVAGSLGIGMRQYGRST